MCAWDRVVRWGWAVPVRRAVIPVTPCSHAHEVTGRNTHGESITPGISPLSIYGQQVPCAVVRGGLYRSCFTETAERLWLTKAQLPGISLVSSHSLYRVPRLPVLLCRDYGNWTSNSCITGISATT